MCRLCEENPELQLPEDVFQDGADFYQRAGIGGYRRIFTASEKVRDFDLNAAIRARREFLLQHEDSDEEFIIFQGESCAELETRGDIRLIETPSGVKLWIELCPVCGTLAYRKGKIRDGRIVMSCNDAVQESALESLAPPAPSASQSPASQSENQTPKVCERTRRFL